VINFVVLKPQGSTVLLQV
jgi:hypothetical protein